MTADRQEAEAYHNAPVALVTTDLAKYDDFKAIDDEFPDHEAFIKFAAMLKSAETSVNTARSNSGLPGISYSVRSVYDTPVFGTSPREDGVVVYMNHWGPAPQYPAAATFGDFLNLAERFAFQDQVTNKYGACYGMETLRLAKSHAAYAPILKKYKNTPALTTGHDELFIRYFKIPKAFPVARSADEIDPNSLFTARSEMEAEKLGGIGTAIATDFLKKTWKRPSTVERNHSDYHIYPWANVAATAKGHYGTEIRYWKIDAASTGLSPAHRKQLDSRMKQRLTTTVEQKSPQFGLFEKIQVPYEPYDDISEEGSGRIMGL